MITKHELPDAVTELPSTDVVERIRHANFVVDDYLGFAAARGNSPFLTPLAPEDYQKYGIHTYQVNGVSAGFALQPDGGG